METLFVGMILMVCSAGVRVSEETIILPTYETKDPEKVPLFYRGEEVQLAERHVYPYPFYDVQAGEKKDKRYKALILENDYLKLCVTPEMGGRLYYALDKTNQYEIVYNNRVVKPALIGTLGAWTSGGIEWNTPHHHRATSLLKVDYTVTEHPDGGKTVWVGEYEKRNQTRWLAGLTLEPGKAYVKITFKSMNVTPFAYPALYFANTAVHVNDDYQFIFPPDVAMMNFHYVTEFCRWPVLNQVYQSVDYTHGEDLSWWNATREPTSFFVTKTKQDFMGGIDHGKRAGILMLGDHRIFKGKKLWNWGKNEVQQVWDAKLTDEDGPYAELMMGFYSDNQPDYNFVAPFETKYGDMYLYGIKNMTGIKEANRDCAVNLELNGPIARVQANATSELEALRIVLLNNGIPAAEDIVNVSPLQPYEKTFDVGDDVVLESLKLVIYKSNGDELISWRKMPDREEPFPEPYRDPLDPREYDNSQDLYFAGLKLEQFGNTNYDYMKYYQAALTHNPNDVLVNTQLGQVFLKRREYEQAEIHLRRAVDIVTGNHKKALDASSLYYLGVCCLKQGRYDEALDHLYRATWAYAWTSAGYTLAAQVEAAQGRWDKALDAAERAYRANTQNVEALTARSIALRRLGRYAEAWAVVQETLQTDPLCFVAMNERRLLSGRTDVGAPTEGNLAILLGHLREDPYNFIETATRYGAFGLFDEAAELMQLATQSEYEAVRMFPMTYYHLARYSARAGAEEAARQALKTASGLSTTLCFPYGDESIESLRFALSQNPDDGTAWYLLGNALADYQHTKALECWENALEKRGNDALIFRNIAYIQANHFQQMEAATENIMKAISLDPSEPRYFSEAALYLSYARLTPEQLEEFLNKYGALGRNFVDIQLLQIKLDIFKGEYDHAIQLLSDMRYHIKEGATFNPHVYWFDAHRWKGVDLMRQGKYAEAEASFLKGMEFPANLEAERNSKVGIAHYYLGLNSRLVGKWAEAQRHYTDMIAYIPSQGWGAGDFPELDYFKTLARLELDKDEEQARTSFQKLMEDGARRLGTVRDGRHITVAVEESHAAKVFLLEREIEWKNRKVSSYYLQGLGHLGLGNKETAQSFFEKALDVDPLSIDPKHMLALL